IGLVGPDDPVANLLALLVLEPHGGGERHPVAARRRVDHLGGADLAVQLVDPALGEALLLAGRVVLGVLGEVAVGARLGDRLDDGGALDALEALELLLELVVARSGHRGPRHRHGGTLSRAPSCARRGPPDPLTDQQATCPRPRWPPPCSYQVADSRDEARTREWGGLRNALSIRTRGRGAPAGDRRRRLGADGDRHRRSRRPAVQGRRARRWPDVSR